MPTAVSERRPRAPFSGWIEAFLYVFAIAVLSVVYVVGHRVGAHPIAFVLYAVAVSAVVLLTCTGPGPDALRIILAPQSWLVGAGIIAIEVFYYILLEYVTPAQGNLLVRLSIPLSLLLGWALFARRPRPLAIVGALIVCAGIIPVFFAVEPQHRAMTFAAAFASALAVMLRSFASEFHPFNRRAQTVMEKLRVTGLVVLVTSVASLVLTGTLSLLIAQGHLPATRLIPTAAQMLHGPTLALGIFVGGAMLTTMAVLSFSAVVKITTENFTASGAFTPVATLLVQSGASAIGLIPAYTLERSLLPAMAVVVGGVLLIFVAARRH